VHQTELGQPARINPFDPVAVAKMVGGTRGRRHFEDSLGTCIFTTRTTLAMLCRVLSAATGWEFTKDDAVTFGRRTAALMRAFNVRCGITPDLERPSKRYGSVPVDGPAKGQDVGQNWERMVHLWYETVGYDHQTGKPLPATLEELGLTELIPTLWG
jgi:aldehyde:ferredoxin oxidoreductase